MPKTEEALWEFLLRKAIGLGVLCLDDILQMILSPCFFCVTCCDTPEKTIFLLYNSKIIFTFATKQIFEAMYKNIDEPVMTAQDTDTMGLEKARELLHQMVKEVYSRP